MAGPEMTQPKALFPDYGMPPQGGRFPPGAGATGWMQPGSFFAQDQMPPPYQQPMPPYIQHPYAPQQAAVNEVPPGMQQPFMVPYPMQQTGELPPVPQEMGAQWWAGPDQRMPFDMLPHDHTPQVRTQL